MGAQVCPCRNVSWLPACILACWPRALSPVPCNITYFLQCWKSLTWGTSQSNIQYWKLNASMGGFSLIWTAKRRNSTHTRIRILTTEHWASKATVMIAPPVVMVWRETVTILTSHSLGKAHFLCQVKQNVMSLVWERQWAEKLGIFKLKVFFSILQSKIFTLLIYFSSLIILLLQFQ